MMIVPMNFNSEHKAMLEHCKNDIMPSGDSQLHSWFGIVQINASDFSCFSGCSGTPSQDFDVVASGEYYFYPAVSVDSSGNLDVIFGYSDGFSNYSSLAKTGQVAGSPGSLDPAQGAAAVS